RCGSGTYIRSLAYDLGQALGCGGHIVKLRRTAVGDFTEANAMPLAELTDENWQDHLLPMTKAVAHLPRLNLNETDALDMRHGRAISVQPRQPEQYLAAAFDPAGLFIGIVRRQAQSWRAKKILHPMTQT
ncbi:MAG: tRNA pseudouridine(55) synthase TruB, partial [Anaerolineae bacterium]